MTDDAPGLGVAVIVRDSDGYPIELIERSAA